MPLLLPTQPQRHYPLPRFSGNDEGKPAGKFPPPLPPFFPKPPVKLPPPAPPKPAMSALPPGFDWTTILAQMGTSAAAGANHMSLNTPIAKFSPEQLLADSFYALQTEVADLPNACQLTSAQQKRGEQMAKGYLLLGDKTAARDVLTNLRNGQTTDLAPTEKRFLTRFFGSLGIYPATIHDSQVGRWNFRYLSVLKAELDTPSPYRPQLKQLCKAALEGRYTDFLHDATTELGRNNLKTQRAFAQNGLNYDQWMNYDAPVSFQRPGFDVVQDRAGRLWNALIEYDPSERKYLDKVLARTDFTFQDGKLHTTSTRDMAKRLDMIIGTLPPSVGKPFKPIPPQWLDGDDAVPFAKQSSKPVPPELLYIGDTTHRLQSTLRQLSDNPASETFEIRRWQREPGKDLFQANDTGSCIALGFGRGEGSVDVMSNSFVQLAEFFNKDKNQVTGKALFFWCRDMNRGNEPVLVINTFEGRGDCCEEAPSARDALMQYAKGYAKAVAGRDNVRIYTADHPWNPLYKGDAKQVVLDLHPIGDSLTGEYYFDTFGESWGKVDAPHRKVSIIELSDGQPPTVAS